MRVPKNALKKLGILWIYYAVTILYGAAVVGLFLGFYVLNGFTLNRVEFTWDDLPEKWDTGRKQKFLRELPENRKRAQRLLYVLLPLIVTLFISYIELTYFT